MFKIRGERKINYTLLLTNPDLADYDLQTARAMLETKRYLYVGFMTHQVAEKALKAVFVSRKPDEVLPYIHDLVRLANRAEISQEMSEEQLSFLRDLAPLNIESRYPQEKGQLLKLLTSEYCVELIRRTEELLVWLKAKC